MKQSTNLSALSLVLVAALALVACDAAPAATPPEEGAPAASFSSEISYEVVNLLLDNSGNPVAVDAYVRDPDVDRAIPFANGVGYGETAEFPAPGDGGVVVTQAGSSNPLCTGTCPYTLATTTVADGQGDERILIVRNGGGLELWADASPAPDAPMSALPAADPAASLVLALGIGDDYRLSIDGQTGCQPAAEPVTVGDTEVSVIQVAGANTNLLVHAADDADCTGEPIAAPVSYTPANGSRTLLLMFPDADDDARAKTVDLKI